MGFEFKNWKKFRDQMKAESLDVAKFKFRYYECEFEIIYSIEQNVFFVAKIGAQIAFRIDLDWYKASVVLDNEPYMALVKCKNTAYDPTKKYNPFDFLKALDDYLGTKPRIVKAESHDFYTVSRLATPDEEKIYFRCFVPHKVGTRHVTGANIAKVRKILGYHIAEFCKEHNVSVAFTTEPSEKSFDIVENPKKTLENNIVVE